MFLSGVSTRTLSMISQRLIAINILRRVSRCSRELVQAMRNWRNRDLSLLKFKYLFCDAFILNACGQKHRESLSFGGIGVTENGQKQVIGIQSGDKNLLPVGGRPLRI